MNRINAKIEREIGAKSGAAQQRPGDQREHRRASVSTPVTYRHTEQSSGVHDGVARNVSEGGMQLATDEQLASGTTLDLRVQINDHSISARGRVALAFFDGRDKTFAHAIAFTQLDSDARERLARYVSAASSPIKP